MAIRKSKTPYVRDVYLAYLIDGARRTETDEFPIIEEWMVTTEPPKEIIQWDRRRDVKNRLTQRFVSIVAIQDFNQYWEILKDTLKK